MRFLEQVRKQLEKIVTVVRVDDVSGKDHVERDMMLIKVKAPIGKRSEICELTSIFRGRIVDVSADVVMIEISRARRQDRVVHRADATVRDYRIGTYGAYCHGPWKHHHERLGLSCPPIHLVLPSDLIQPFLSSQPLSTRLVTSESPLC